MDLLVADDIDVIVYGNGVWCMIHLGDLLIYNKKKSNNKHKWFKGFLDMNNDISLGDEVKVELEKFSLDVFKDYLSLYFSGVDSSDKHFRSRLGAFKVMLKLSYNFDLDLTFIRGTR